MYVPLITGKEKGATWPSRSRSKMWCINVTWSLSANGISLSLSSCSRLLWKRLSRSSLGRQGELWICSSFSIAATNLCYCELLQKFCFFKIDVRYILLVIEVQCAGPYEYSTCAECEEEEFNLLAFWEQLNEIKLEGNHMNAVLRRQSLS